MAESPARTQSGPDLFGARPPGNVIAVGGPRLHPLGCRTSYGKPRPILLDLPCIGSYAPGHRDGVIAVTASGTDLVVQVSSVVLGAIWVVAGVAKLRHLNTFAHAAGVMLLPLPASLIQRVAGLIPAGELLLAVLIFWPNTRRVGLGLSTTSLVAFTGGFTGGSVTNCCNGSHVAFCRTCSGPRTCRCGCQSSIAC